MGCINPKSQEYSNVLDKVKDNILAEALLKYRETGNVEDSIVNQFIAPEDGFEADMDAMDDSSEITVNVQPRNGPVQLNVVSPDVLEGYFPTVFNNKGYKTSLAGIDLPVDTFNGYKGVAVTGRLTTENFDVLTIENGNSYMEKPYILIGYENLPTDDEVSKALRTKKVQEFSTPFYIGTSSTAKEHEEPVVLTAIPSLEEQKQQLGNEIVSKIADTLKKNTGLDYNLVNKQQASELLANTKYPYKDQAAFSYKGKVYFVGDNINSETVFHEYGHFVVDSLPKETLDSIYNQFATTDIGRQIRDTVDMDSPELTEQDKRKESMTRALGKIANEKAEMLRQEPWYRKLWYEVKRLLRKIFGVGFPSINETTSLQGLADILTSNNKIQLDTQLISERDYALFMTNVQELAKDLEGMDDSPFAKMAENFFSITKDHLSRIMSNPNMKDIQNLISPEEQRNSLASIKDKMKSILEDMEDVRKRVTTMAVAIDQIVRLTGEISNRISEIGKDNSMSSKDKLGHLFYYAQLLREWKGFIDHLRSENSGLDLPGEHKLNEFLDKISGNLDRALSSVNKFDKEGVVDAFVELLSTADNNIRKKIEEKIAKLDAVKDAQKIADLKEQLKKYTYDKDTVRKFVEGKMGDTNALSSFVMSYISQKDPIVGGFASFVKQAFYEVEAQQRKFNFDFVKEVETAARNAGMLQDINSPRKFYLPFLKVEKKFRIVDGQQVDTPVYTLMNQFNDYKYDLTKLNYEIDQEKDPAKKRQLVKEKATLLKDYFHRKYTKEFYDLDKIFEDPIGQIAKEQRQAILDEIKYIQEVSYDAAGDEEKEEILNSIELLWKQYSNLSSTMDLDGNKKDEQGIAVANKIKEYNSTSRKFYEWVPKKGVFDDAFRLEQQRIDALGLRDFEARKKMEDWIKANTRAVISQDFFDTRKKIIDELQSYLLQIAGNKEKSEEQSKVFEDIFDIIKGFRDDDGQPVGTELNDNQTAKIKEAQVKLEEIKEKYRELAGGAHDKFIGSQIQKAVEKLDELQSKVPTSYYMETLNHYLGKMEKPTLDLSTAEKILAVGEASRLMAEYAGFKTWFEANHILVYKYDKDTGSMVKQYERLYQWNRIVPNDKNYYETYTLPNGETINAVPTLKYFIKRVKDQYRTKRLEGVNIDNQGNPLPLTLAQGAKDDHYINHEYNNMKLNQPKKFEVLRTLTDYHLKSQENTNRINRLGYEIPRFRKEWDETNQEGAKAIWERAKSEVTIRPDDFLGDIGNFKPHSTDPLGKIPIHGLSYLDLDETSLDVASSILEYNKGALVNKKLVEINPLATALQSVLNTEGLKGQDELEGINKNIWQKFNILNIIKGKSYVRLKTINNLCEKIFLGKNVNDSFLPKGVEKMLNTMLGLAAKTSLSANIPGAIKNVSAAHIQNFIESLSGKYVNKQDYKNGSLMMLRFNNKMVQDYQKMSGLSMETQLYDAFDPVQGKFMEHYATRVNGNYKRSALAGNWLMAGQEFGEINAQGSFWLAMMHHQLVPQTVNGETRDIRYVDAWETGADGYLKLKDGVDDSWAEGGKDFKEFKLKLHELLELLQGNYAKIDQPEIDRMNPEPQYPGWPDGTKYSKGNVRSVPNYFVPPDYSNAADYNLLERASGLKPLLYKNGGQYSLSDHEVEYLRSIGYKVTPI